MAQSIRIVRPPRPAKLHPLGITFAPPKEATWPCFILIRCGGAREPERDAKVIPFQALLTHHS